MADKVSMTVRGNVTAGISIAGGSSVGVSTPPVSVIMKGLSGKSPYVNTTTMTWMVYDDDAKTWVDSGIRVDGGEVELEIDDVLSNTSTNAVQNKVITGALNGIVVDEAITNE